MDKRALRAPGVPADVAYLPLAETTTHGEAIVIRQLLSSYEIPCTLESDMPHRLIPVFGPAACRFTVCVPSSLFDEADTLLAEHRRQAFRLLDGGRRR